MCLNCTIEFLVSRLGAALLAEPEALQPTPPLPLDCAVGTSSKRSTTRVFSERSGPAVSHRQLFPFKDCKWKMYVELDGDEIAVTYIKDVVFNANRADVETLRMTKVLGLQQGFGFRADGSDS